MTFSLGMTWLELLGVPARLTLRPVAAARAGWLASFARVHLPSDCRSSAAAGMLTPLVANTHHLRGKPGHRNKLHPSPPNACARSGGLPYGGHRPSPPHFWERPGRRPRTAAPAGVAGRLQSRPLLSAAPRLGRPADRRLGCNAMPRSGTATRLWLIVAGGATFAAFRLTPACSARSTWRCSSCWSPIVRGVASSPPGQAGLPGQRSRARLFVLLVSRLARRLARGEWRRPSPKSVVRRPLVEPRRGVAGVPSAQQ